MSEPGASYQADLNEEQWAAVSAPNGAVLVIAAAGTGKTRTLVYRVAWLVQQGVDPQQILLLTFTNRAAREMLDRARELVGDSVGGMWGGTFHHMANRILRRHSPSLGYGNDYTILDQDDAKSLVKICTQDFKLTDKHFPKPDVLLNLFSYAANTEKSVETLAHERFEDSPIDVDDVVRVHAGYQKKKRDLNAMDFDDLLVNGLKLFRDHPPLLDHYRNRFAHILVDEYQDTNTIQSQWVDLIVGPRGNLLVVGDDFQSIYSWRGADFRNILSLPERYPGTQIFKLVTNYRSVPEILNVANACIAGNTEQFQKTLVAVREPYRKPVRVELRDGQEQAAYVVERIRALRFEGYKMSDIAILYRSHFHALDVQLELARGGLTYLITSGVRFFEQAHIKDVCALLRLLCNPGDELAFQRMVCLWPRLGPKTAMKLWSKLGGRCDLSKEATRVRLSEMMPAAARDGWACVSAIAADYDKDDLTHDPGEVIHRFVKSFYDVYALETFENYDRRIEDIKELINYTARFESIDQFMSDVALQTNLDERPDVEEVDAQQSVRLSTVHQAKGLEWKVVFLVWMCEGLFPSQRSLDEVDDTEERRLFYVATTRAKDELYLCCPRLRRTRDGGIQMMTPSRFVEEVPRELMEKVRPGW